MADQSRLMDLRGFLPRTQSGETANIRWYLSLRMFCRLAAAKHCLHS
jgi:hypothetical protein